MLLHLGIFVDPSNLGRCYPASTLLALMKLCQKNAIHMISDEVYALSVYDTRDPDLPTFTSALSVNPEGTIDVERLHVFYGMSKVSSFSSCSPDASC